MRYKMLGETGLNVSEISLGTWGIGGAGWGNTNYNSCEEAMETMLAQGVNLIDTAPAYNDGQAERFLGKVLHKKRDQLYYVTKTGTQYKNGVYFQDNSANAIRTQCEESLRFLNTDFIDVYLVHWPDKKTPMEETFEELSKLKEEGKIGHIGVSNFSIPQIEEASKYAKIEVLQDQFSMVYGNKKDTILKASEMGIGIMTYGSMGAGILSGKMNKKEELQQGDMRKNFYHFYEEPLHSKIQKLLLEIQKVAERHGNVPISQVALNWNIQKEYVNSAIVGVRTASHALENCKSTEWMLSDEEIVLLDGCVKQIVG